MAPPLATTKNPFDVLNGKEAAEVSSQRFTTKKNQAKNTNHHQQSTPDSPLMAPEKDSTVQSAGIRNRKEGKNRVEKNKRGSKNGNKEHNGAASGFQPRSPADGGRPAERDQMDALEQNNDVGYPDEGVNPSMTLELLFLAALLLFAFVMFAPAAWMKLQESAVFVIFSYNLKLRIRKLLKILGEQVSKISAS